MAKKNYRCTRLATLALVLFFTNCRNIEQKELQGSYYESSLGDKYSLLIDSNYIVQTIATQILTVDSLNNRVLKDTTIVNKCNFFIDGNEIVFDGWYIHDTKGHSTLCVGCPLAYQNGKLTMNYFSLDGKKYTFYKVR